MSIYTPAVEMLDEVIASYRKEFQQADKVVSENGFLDNYDMNHLLKSNSKAQAALKARAVVTSVEEEDRSNVCRMVEAWMNDAIKSGNYSVAHLYESVLRILNKTVSVSDS